MKIKIKNQEIHSILEVPEQIFPRYTTQILNIANRNSQATRPKIVGNMSELIQEFPGKTIGEWKTWYTKKHPHAIDDAVNMILPMIESIQTSADSIDKTMVEQWVEDLIINKTFAGLKFQQAILQRVAEQENAPYGTSTSPEEKRGIDGYINNEPVSIKPMSYKNNALKESLPHRIIYYEKNKDGISVFL